MFNNFFKKKKYDVNKNVLVAALLVHAAKIDENYTDAERKIIKQTIIELGNVTPEESEVILIDAEKKEQESNQIVEFTKEIKKNSMKFRIKIIEILWKIIYSDGTSDIYEANLIRRICGLLYVSDKESGIIKLRIKSTK